MLIRHGRTLAVLKFLRGALNSRPTVIKALASSSPDLLNADASTSEQELWHRGNRAR
jgi:hypothetical protein